MIPFEVFGLLRVALVYLPILLCISFTTDRVFANADQLTLRVERTGGDQTVSCGTLRLSRTVENISLDRAIELLNCKNWGEIAGNRGKVDVVIELGPGTYRLNAAMRLRWGNDTAQGQLSITGAGKQGTIISGARELKDFQLARDESILRQLTPSAHGKVLVVDVRAVGLTNLGPSVGRVFGNAPVPVTTELFFQGQAMKIASWPNQGWTRSRIDIARQGELPIRLGVSGRDLALWSTEPDIVVRGYFAEEYAEETIPVDAIDMATNTFVLSMPGPKFGVKNDMRVKIENVLMELDQPGEWYLDRKSGLIYFWPPRPIQEGMAEVSFLENLILISDSRDILISGLTLEMPRGDAVRILNSNNVVVSKSTIRNAGNRAVVVSGGINSGVDEIQIYDTGEGGVVLNGGDRQKLAAANLFVKHSHITRFNRLLSTYRPAIQIDGVGNASVANVIFDAPHTAIIFRGNDHLIAHNDISHVVKDTNDAGAIYTGRDWTARGTVIRNNFLHDIGRLGASKLYRMGIYLDDQASGISVTENIFFRVQNPVFIGGGRDNMIKNNLFVNSFPAIHLDARGKTWQKNKTDDPAWDLRRRLAAVPYTQSPYAEKYLHLANILDDEPGAPKYNVFSGNMIIGPADFSVRKEAETGILMHSTCYETEDIFLKEMPAEFRIDRGDFQLKQVAGTQDCRVDLPNETQVK